MTLPLSRNGRRYGYLRNPPDHRDFGATSLRLSIVGLPSSASLKTYLGPVKDQGDEGSCVGHAGTENLEFLARRYPATFPFKHDTPPIFSAQDLYHQCLAFDGDPNDDNGTSGRTACKVMQSKGVCLESTYPYVAGQYAITPPPAADTEALLNRSGAYHFLATVGDIKSCIASGYCCMIGFTVYESFENIGSDGLMPSPNKASEAVLGGHEVLCYGYNDSTQRISILNSWGPSFGDAGSFYMKYSDAADPDIVMDVVIQHLSKPW